MAIKVIFPAGSTSVSLEPLTQWDYGQQLEIESAELDGLIEVHFACHDMKEAIVRSCSVLNNVAVVSIPDVCLEQTSNITAWVYEVGDTSGKTVRTITIPIIARQKPIPCADVPVSIADKYTEAVDAMNELVDAYKDTIPGAAQAEIAAIQSAGNAAVTNVNTATQGALQNIDTAKDDAIAEVMSHGVHPAPTENTQKKLTEGYGYYYVQAGAYSFGISYWDGRGMYSSSVAFLGMENRGSLVCYIGADGSIAVKQYFSGGTVESVTDSMAIYTAKLA